MACQEERADVLPRAHQRENLKVDTAPLVPFPSETHVQAPAAALDDTVNPDRLSNGNTVVNIKGGLSPNQAAPPARHHC
jgi:hypothetical protein